MANLNPEAEDFEAAREDSTDWAHLSEVERRARAVHAKALRLYCSGAHRELPPPLALYVEALATKPFQWPPQPIAAA